MQSRLQFKCRGQAFDKFWYKARTIPLSLSMDANLRQSLETLCLKFSTKSGEFESEGDREIMRKEEEKKKRKTDKKCSSCLQT